MARRAPAGEGPFRPLLDPEAISAAMAKPTDAAWEAQTVRAMSLAPRTERVNGSIQSPLQSSPQTIAIIELPREASRPNAIGDLVEKFEQERRMLLTPREGAAFDRLVSTLAGRLRTQVKMSHVLRALVALALNAEAEIDQRAGAAVGLARPPNGDVNAIQRFERDIARVLGAALRDAGPLR